MTRNEYINAFNTYITANTPPLTPYVVIVSNINKWVDQIDEDLSRCFKAEIEKIAGRLCIHDIIKTFKGSRLLSRLVNKDILSEFGREKYPGSSHVVSYKWFGDTIKGYVKIKGMDPSSLFPQRWAAEFKANSALILKAATKTVVAGDNRTIHPMANCIIKTNSYKGKVLISVIWSPNRKPKDEEVVKYQNISYDTLNTIEQALALMDTVEKYETQEINHFYGWKGYEVLVKVREIKCVVPKTDAEIYQEKCEEIVNTDKEPATLEDLIDTLNSPIPMAPTPITKSKFPEVIALEKAYDEALAINKKATEDYTAAKKLWEESTNRLDRLEQALELLK